MTIQIVVDRLRKLKKITSDVVYKYHLTHTYDNKPSNFAISVNIEPEIMRPLLAYIEFMVERVDESVCLEYGILAQLINKYYAKVNMIEKSEECIHIDLYENREYWCGSLIWELLVFQNQHMCWELENMYGEG